MVNNSFDEGDSKLARLERLNLLFGWLKRHYRPFLLASIGFQIAVLLSMILTPFTTLITGDTILLRVVPVDPRDLLRGDYVILSYEFSRMPPQSIQYLNSADHQRHTVYVTIVPEIDGKHWRSSQVSLQKPSTGKFLQGQTAGSQEQRRVSAAGRDRECGRGPLRAQSACAQDAG